MLEFLLVSCSGNLLQSTQLLNGDLVSTGEAAHPVATSMDTWCCSGKQMTTAMSHITSEGPGGASSDVTHLHLCDMVQPLVGY